MMIEIPDFDQDGQRLKLAWNRQRRLDAGIDELIGLIKGVIADREVTASEILYLDEWTRKHPDIANDWPTNIVMARLKRILSDNRIDDDEREDIKALLIEIVGENDGRADPLIDSATSKPTQLPLCRPSPDVIFDQNIFVFTGKFAYGPRRICEAEVLQRGGHTSDSVTLQTSYVVIGAVGNRDWIHSSWGRKIEKAVEYRQLCPLAIISEQHWASFLLPAGRLQSIAER